MTTSVSVGQPLMDYAMDKGEQKLEEFGNRIWPLVEQMVEDSRWAMRPE